MKAKRLKSWLFLSLTCVTSAYAGSDYEFGTLIQKPCSIAEVAPRVKEELQSLFQSGYYDRTVYFLETPTNPLTLSSAGEGFKSFDSLEIFEKYGTGNCVAFSKHFRKRLQEKIGIEFQLISSTVPKALQQPGMPPYPHAGLILWCQDGYLLTDPSMILPEPIVLREGQPYYLDLRQRGLWKFDLQERDGKIQVTPDSSPSTSIVWTPERKEEASFYYLLKETKNPDQAVTARHFLNDRKVLIFPLNQPNEPGYKMVIHLLKKQIEYSEFLPDGKTTFIFTLPFETHREDPESFYKTLSEEVAGQLRIPRDILIKRVTSVIERTL